MVKEERERDPVGRIKRLLMGVLSSLKRLLRLADKKLGDEMREVESQESNKL